MNSQWLVSAGRVRYSRKGGKTKLKTVEGLGGIDDENLNVQERAGLMPVLEAHICYWRGEQKAVTTHLDYLKTTPLLQAPYTSRFRPCAVSETQPRVSVQPFAG